MPYLADSNILLRTGNRADPDHARIRNAVRTLRLQGEPLHYTSQNLGEMWNVCTRPTTARGGYGLNIESTDRRVRLIERLFTLLPDTPAVHAAWRQLIVTHSVHGVQVHDARIAAAMQVHGITHILTLNVSDFARYSHITAVHPNDVQ